MKTTYFTLVLAAVLEAATLGVKTSPAQCVLEWTAEDQVEIPVVFEFRNAQFREDWIYNSFSPYITLPKNKHEARRPRAAVHDGRLEVSFCASASDLRSPESKFTLHFGVRKFQIALRPITWSVTTTTNSQGRQIRQGRMATISLIDQPDPDWLAVKSAKFLETFEKTPIIEIEFYNFSGRVHPGVEIKFYSQFVKLCAGVGQTTTGTVPVSISVFRDQPRLSSADPQFTTMISRNVQFRYQECGESYLIADMGPSGVLPANGAFRLRYVFKQTLGRTTQKDPSPTHDPLLFFYLPNRRFLFEGDRICPTEIFIEGGKVFRNGKLFDSQSR